MNRRTLLAGVSLPLVGGGVVIAQQFDYLRDKDFPIRTEPPITGHEFELGYPQERFGNGSDDPERRFANYATVEFDSTEKRVLVLGRVESGSRSCKETELKALRYDESSDTLTVVVFDDYIYHNACTGELGAVPYTVSVSFESNLPSRVVVKHVRDGNGVAYEEAFGSENRN